VVPAVRRGVDLPAAPGAASRGGSSDGAGRASPRSLAGPAAAMGYCNMSRLAPLLVIALAAGACASAGTGSPGPDRAGSEPGVVTGVVETVVPFHSVAIVRFPWGTQIVYLEPRQMYGLREGDRIDFDSALRPLRRWPGASGPSTPAERLARGWDAMGSGFSGFGAFDSPGPVL